MGNYNNTKINDITNTINNHNGIEFNSNTNSTATATANTDKSTADNSNKRVRYRFSCPLIYSLLAISISQLIAATMIIYFLTYSAIINTVEHIQSSNRLILLEHARIEIDNRLSSTIELVSAIEYRVISRFPTFNQKTSIINDSGVFSDLSFFVQNVAYLNAAGIGNSGGLLIRGGIGPSGDQNQPRLYSICDSVINFNCNYYSNSLINTTNNNIPINPNLINRNNVPIRLIPSSISIGSVIDSNGRQLQDFIPTDHIDILKPESIYIGYNTTNREFFKAAINAPIPGTVQFSTAYYTVKGPLQGIEAITASKVVNFPVLSNNNNAINYTTVAFVQLYLNFIDSMLATLHYSPNTVLFLIDTSGQLIGTSRANIKLNYKLAGYQSILQSNDPYLFNIGLSLLTNGYIAPNPLIETVTAFKSRFRPPPPITNQPVSIDSGKHFTASMLSTTGLLWTIVVLTDDSEFESTYISTFQLMIVWTCIIIVVASMITVVAIRQISRPLLKLVSLISDIIKASAVETADNQLINHKSTVSNRSKLVLALTKKWNSINFNNKFNLFGIELSVTEANLLSLTLSEMLTALSAMSSEMNEINLAKQQFIRYIFHEVRVPYNSIVLGIDQLQILMREIGLTNLSPGNTPSQLLAQNRAIHINNTATNAAAAVPHVIPVSNSNSSPNQQDQSQSLVLSANNTPIINTPLSIIKSGLINPINPIHPPIINNLNHSRSGSIKHPLNNVLSFNNINQQQQHIQNDITSILDILHQQSKIVSMILNDVLSLQKIEEGALQLDYSPFCMHCLILRTLQSFQSEVEAKQLTVKLILPIINNSSSLLSPSITESLSSTTTATTTTAAPTLANGSTPTITPSISTDSNSNSIIDSNRIFELSALHEFQQLQYELNHHSHLILLGDRYRLRQVFSNYLSNAVKFTPENKGKIEIKLVLDPINSINQLWNCRLQVSDNGPGMSSIESASLFKPFSQLSDGRAQGNKGTGLGLSICKSLIELHSGRVGVNSIVGIGSEFYFELILSESILSPSMNNSDNNINNNIHPVIVNNESRLEINPELPVTITVTGTVTGTGLGAGAAALISPLANSINPIAEYPSIDSLNSRNQNRNANLIQIATAAAAAEVNYDDGDSDGNGTNTVIDAINKEFNSLRTIKVDRIGIKPTIATTTTTAIATATSTPTPTVTVTTISPSPSPSNPNRQYKLLIIEDSFASQKLLCMLLRSLNYHCTAVDNGFLGLLQLVEINSVIPNSESKTLNQKQLNQLYDQNIYRLIQPCPYDCILIDRQMPVLDGLESTKIMRSLGVEIPIIACTGAALDEDQAEFRLAGINDFLTKPIQKKRLISCLNNIFSSTSSHIHQSR